MTTRAIAHRGSSQAMPEQTRAAYLLALAEGADGVECDVRLSADRRVVCFHDATVDRTSNGTGPLHEKTLEELRALDISSWFGVSAVGPQLLTLEELLEILLEAGRETTLAIELKHPNPFGLELETEVLSVLESMGWDAATSTLGTVTISFMSFNPLSIEALAPHVDPRHLMILTADLNVSDLIGEAPGEDLASPEAAAQLEAAVSGGRAMLAAGMVGGAGPDIELLRSQPDLVRSWIDAGLLVRVWTADSAEDIDLCLELGVQEITTNVPAAVLERVGQGR